MEFTFLNIMIIYVIILVTYLLRVISNKITISTYNPLIDSYAIDALQYTRDITGSSIYSTNFSKCTEKEKNLFIGHAIGYMKLNHKDVLREMGINNDEKICSILVSKLR